MPIGWSISWSRRNAQLQESKKRIDETNFASAPRNSHLVPVHCYAPGVILTLVFLFYLRLRLTVA